MLNLLCDGGLTFVNDDWRVWLTIAIAVACLAGGIAIYLMRGKMSKKALKIGSYSLGGVFSAAILAVLIASVIYAAQDGAFDADYSVWLICLAAFIVLLMVVVTFLAHKKFNNPQADKYKWYGIYGAIALIAACGIAAVVLGIINSAGNAAFSGNAGVWTATGIFIIIAFCVLLAAFIDRGAEGKNNTVALVYAAICIAISFALSWVKFLEMPQGGSVTLASLLPIALYSYIFGFRRGIICCCIYGMMQMLQDPFLAHPIQVLLDYPIAFMFVGCAGAFRRVFKKYPQIGFALGIVIAVGIRYIAHLLSGAVFFWEYAGGQNPWIYSLAYNSFVWVDGAIDVVVGVLLLSSGHMRREVDRIRLKYTGTSESVEEQKKAENCSN